MRAATGQPGARYQRRQSPEESAIAGVGINQMPRLGHGPGEGGGGATGQLEEVGSRRRMGGAVGDMAAGGGGRVCGWVRLRVA